MNSLGLVLILAACVFCLVKSMATIFKLKKYEFENRSDGGVIKFKSFADSQKHNLLRKYLPAAMVISVVIGVPTFLMLMSKMGIRFQ